MMENNDPNAVLGAGQECPAHAKVFGTPEEGHAVRESGDSTSFGEVTAEERAAIHQCLQKPGAPGGRDGRAWALAKCALKYAVGVLLAAGVVAGFSDGDEFDDVGCTVAQQPGQTCHGAHSGQVGEQGGGKVPGCGGGSDGGSGDGGPAGRPECEARAERCPNRMADGQCQMSKEQCRLFVGAVEVREMAALQAQPTAFWGSQWARSPSSITRPAARGGANRRRFRGMAPARTTSLSRTWYTLVATWPPISVTRSE